MNIEVPKGMSIYNAISYVKELAYKERYNYLNFTFNNIELCVYKESLESDICKIYDLECRLRRMEQLK